MPPRTSSSFSFSFCSFVISFLGKALNLNVNNEIQDESENNIINKKSFGIKIIKFCLENVMNLLQAKVNKSVIKKLLGNIIKFLKIADSFDESIIILTFKSICNNINFVRMFRSYTETYVKMSVKYWLQLKGEDNNVCLEFLKLISKSGEYDFVIKTSYLGYLSIAKAMNINSKDKIEKLSNELSDLITCVAIAFLFLLIIFLPSAQSGRFYSAKNQFTYFIIILS